IILSARHITFKNDSEEKRSLWVRLAEYRPENKKWLVIITVILTIIFSFFSGKVKFDSDLNNINYMTEEQRQSFNELSGYTTLSQQVDFLISEGENPYEALREFEKSKRLIDNAVNIGQIKGSMNVGSGLMSDITQKRRADLWNSFWSTRKDETIANIKKYGTEVGFNSNSFSPFFEMIDSTFVPVPFDHFELFSEDVFKDMIINTPDRSMIVTMVYSKPETRVNTADLIPADSNSFIYDRKNFSDSLIELLMKDFNKVLWICSLIVLVFLTLSFGILELSLLSFIPMLISWIWITAIMAITGIDFNIVNIILATFIFGLGDDYSIFITEGLMQDYSRKRSLLNSYKVAVLLSAITMFIGIGTLVLAKHPAMKSLAIVTIIGMISVVLISYIVAPYLFGLLIKKKGELRTVPVTLGKLFQTVYSFLGFMIFSLLLSIIGFFLLTIGKPTKKNKLRFHKSLYWVIKNVTGLIPGVKSNIINTVGETFDNPSVIICNHQAHIDLAYMMLLSPKVVILTNEWVWNCPFYGRIVKYADFYPVANGIENSVEQLSKLVEDGYSILVFPEGTRSADCSIQRFHKGAFYLAEKLNLDILPILIHGIGHCLPKKEFLLRKGTCTVKIYDRVHPDDDSFGNGYVERTKNFRKFYEQEYDKLAAEMETAEYNKDKVIHNYIYKGATVEYNARKTLRNKTLLQLVNNLPTKGDILFVNC
ncbi:MAG: 1-acyl-sn-glycerol-3-phosphate acyltransferase, partial [Bacteroidales bacterium]|nr:1-acyl-sn-glycerol-3-phosphate acyltransferase [Bacteroidales bacterium]